jgi:hypothetical protein
MTPKRCSTLALTFDLVWLRALSLFFVEPGALNLAVVNNTRIIAVVGISSELP